MADDNGTTKATLAARHVESGGERDYCRLKDAEKFRLWTWLREMKAEIEAEGYTTSVVVQKAEKPLNIELTSAALRGASEVCGVTLGKDHRGGAALQNNMLKRLTDETVQLRQVVADQAEVIAKLAARVDKLEVELGIGVRRIDESLTDVIKRAAAAKR